MSECRYDWTVDEVLRMLNAPLEELCRWAREAYLEHAALDVQKCQLLSIKTGACAEDCAYCAQSVRHKTNLKTEPLIGLSEVLTAAKSAQQEGATRFCMGASWRAVPKGGQFRDLLQIIRAVAALGLEVCGSFGMATEDQLSQMKEAGLTSYNHNLDTSRDYYSRVISTRTYDDRLKTLRAIRNAGILICCGGILGMGESLRDRAALLAELASFQPHPESVPINILVPIKGTSLENQPPITFEEFLRVVATARILMPKSRVRLSAGRNTLSNEQQLECFRVGANSVFMGEKLLTVPNVTTETDKKLFS